MDLGKHVLDKEILDRNGLRAGRIDDLILEIGEPLPDGSLPPPVVEYIVSGPMALAPCMARPTRWIAERLYHILGLSNPQPVEIPWSAVIQMSVVVSVDVDRDHNGMSALESAVGRRYISRIPGS